MNRRNVLLVLLAGVGVSGACAQLGPALDTPPPPWPGLVHNASSPAVEPIARADEPSEPRLRNVRQITFTGENAEAYWSWDASRLIYQMRGRRGIPADQIFILDPATGAEHMVSTGKGKTTCGYFLPGNQQIVYASTHHLGDAAPEPPPATPGKYTWPLFDYDIYRANTDGSDLVRLTDWNGYDAEPTARADGRIVFTSSRDGDLDIYSMEPDGSDVRRLTTEPGYDGGAFFSADGTQIVYRANHPTDPDELATFRELLASGRVQPTRMDLWVMNADGTDRRQVTNLPGASWAPFFHPDGERIIFASNHENPRGPNFDLYLIHVDGTGLERVTSSPAFDGFPMFSPDGRRLVFASNRHAVNPRDTNIFVADWVE